jgi:hypothetical protein
LLLLLLFCCFWTPYVDDETAAVISLNIIQQEAQSAPLSIGTAVHLFSFDWLFSCD